MSFPGLPEPYSEAVTSVRWFEELPAAVQDEVSQRSRLRAFPAGAAVFRRGEAPDGLYRVRDGLVQLSGNSSDGRETILDIYGADAWFGETAALARCARTHDAVALGPVQAQHLPQAHLDRLLDAHPSLALALLRLEARRLRLVLTALEEYSTQSMEQRLANRLLLLADAHGSSSGGGALLRLPLSQEMLARLVGTTRQRVGQILQLWEAQGLVVRGRRRLVITRTDELERLGRM